MHAGVSAAASAGSKRASGDSTRNDAVAQNEDLQQKELSLSREIVSGSSG